MSNAFRTQKPKQKILYNTHKSSLINAVKFFSYYFEDKF